jgi:hypothetical protein
MVEKNSITLNFWFSKWGATKSCVFWDTALFSPLKIHRCFIEVYSLHFQGRLVTNMKQAVGRANCERKNI